MFAHVGVRRGENEILNVVWHISVYKKEVWESLRLIELQYQSAVCVCVSETECDSKTE